MQPPSSISLIELLRRRRALSSAEVTRLLADLPALLDAGGRVSGLLGNLSVVFCDAAALDSSLTHDVRTWPTWRLALHGRENVPAVAEELATSPYLTAASAAPRSTAAQMGELMCELLGGGRRDGHGTLRFSPVAGLSEAGNQILRRSMEEHYEKCADLWKEWLLAVEPAAQAHGEAWEIPAWCEPPGMDPLEYAEFAPLESSAPAIRIVIRDQFRIGRSRRRSDWPARLQRGGVLDEDAAVRVSRVHAVGVWKDGLPALLDGDGARPSANGSCWEGRAMSPGEPVLLNARGVLLLGATYRLEATPILQSGFAALLALPAGWTPSRRQGAVFFRPLDGCELIRDAVWVGSAIGFLLSPEGQVTWNDGTSGRSLGFFVQRGGQIWLANAGAKDENFTVDEHSVAVGEVAPLRDGQTLKIGPARYAVTCVQDEPT